MRCAMAIDVSRCVGCDACAVACKQAHNTHRGMLWTHVERHEVGSYPNAYLEYEPRLCNHCQNAPCVRACPTHASHYDESGAVLVDHSKCVGCRMCMAACPYQARFFNWARPSQDPYCEGMELTPFEKAHADEHPVGVVEKCTFCEERRTQGLEPACVKTCPARARIFGDLDDPASEVYQLVEGHDAAVRLEEYGTEPSVFYIGKR